MKKNLTILVPFVSHVTESNHDITNFTIADVIHMQVLQNPAII